MIGKASVRRQLRYFEIRAHKNPAVHRHRLAFLALVDSAILVTFMKCTITYIAQPRFRCQNTNIRALKQPSSKAERYQISHLGLGLSRVLSELIRSLNTKYSHCSEFFAFAASHPQLFSVVVVLVVASTMLTSRGVTRLSRRAVSNAKRTNALFSTSSPILARAGLFASAGTHSSLRPTRSASSAPGMLFH